MVKLPKREAVFYILNAFFNWIENGPKNRIAYYLFYIPVMVAMSLVVLALFMGVLPEAVAWAFAGACLLTVILWPIIKIAERITGRKML
jgi:hypothetical protein